MTDRIRLIACEVFVRELSAAVARSAHQIDVEWLPKGLHDKGGKVMAAAIQERIDAVDAGRYDRIALAYALCNNGLVGLQARTLPITAYRAHDCIACFLGSRERYDAEFAKTPGTYWQSPGWIERGGEGFFTAGGQSEPKDDDPTWQRLLKKYGADNARFLWDEMQAQVKHYERLAYIDTGVGPANHFAGVAEKRAAEKGLRFELMAGDPAWISALLDGPLTGDRFLTIAPGQQVVAAYDGSIAGVK